MMTIALEAATSPARAWGNPLLTTLLTLASDVARACVGQPFFWVNAGDYSGD